MEDAASPGEIVMTVVTALVYFGAALYMIYDPETPAAATGRMGHSQITAETPAGMVRFAGCVMLTWPLGVPAWILWWPLGIIVALAAAIGAHHLANRWWPI